VSEELHDHGRAIRQAALAAGWSHRHRDVSGGWLRPTVFGAVDGLVTNTSLIAGLGGGGVSAHTVILTGVAALVAGAFSMGTGEYVSVTNQNELVHAEVSTETRHARPVSRRRASRAGGDLRRLRRRPGDGRPDGRRGPRPTRTPRCACIPARSSASTRSTCRPPCSRAASSLIAFSVGAVIPLLPYLAGVKGMGTALGAALVVAAVALLTGGMVVGKLTGRSLLRAGLRQLALGAIAVAVTFAVGHPLIGSGHAP